MPYIYKITNKLNNKVYIGKTLESVDKRWAEHLRDCQRDKNKNRPLYRAIRKYGSDNFTVSVVEECSETNINAREQYWIAVFNSFKNGYNATIGGDGKAYVDSGHILYCWNNGLTLKQIKEQTGYDYSTIRKYLLLNGITKEDINNRRILTISSKVAMIDINTNEVITVFNSLSDAARFIGKDETHISAVCLGKRKTAYGYKWRFAGVVQ